MIYACAFNRQNVFTVFKLYCQVSALTVYSSMRGVFPVGCALFSPLHGRMGAARSLEGRLSTFESPYLSTVDLILRRWLWWRGQICRDETSMFSMREQDK